MSEHRNLKVIRPIKLTLRAELDDGSIRDVILPIFYIPEGDVLVERHSDLSEIAVDDGEIIQRAAVIARKVLDRDILDHKHCCPEWPAQFYAMYPNGVPESAFLASSDGGS